MPGFHYEAVDPEGKVRRGQVEADSPRAARERLRTDGLFPTAVLASEVGPESIERLRLPPVLVSLATRQLATLVRAGMPLDQALAAVAEQADDARVRKTIIGVRD